ncbi:MAG: hypothetical protein JO362_11610 [Streptomycetaceae bacterium]|nr:hypothetical protein [Streptomycetaceae bacterium]
MSGMTIGPVVRTARAAIFAAVCVTTTALGHALMSKTLPWWALGAAFFGTCAAAYCLARKERGVVVVTASTIAAQLGLHSLFDLAQAPTSMADMADMADMDNGMAGMDMSRMSQAPGVTSGGMEQLQVAHTGHGALGMFLAHLLAALVCGLWLWRGEAAAFRLARSLAGLLFTPLLLALTAQGWAGLQLPARPSTAAPLVLRLRTVLLHDVASRRGPPRSFVLLLPARRRSYPSFSASSS